MKNLQDLKDFVQDPSIPTLVILIGAPASGKSTLAKFLTPEDSYATVSTDHMRALISDDSGNQEVSRQAFGMAHRLIKHRVAQRKLTIFDATNTRLRSRREVMTLAREANPEVRIIGISVWSELSSMLKRNDLRSRQVPPEVIESQYNRMTSMQMEHLLEGMDSSFIVRNMTLDFEDSKVIPTAKI